MQRPQSVDTGKYAFGLESSPVPGNICHYATSSAFLHKKQRCTEQASQPE